MERGCPPAANGDPLISLKLLLAPIVNTRIPAFVSPIKRAEPVALTATPRSWFAMLLLSFGVRITVFAVRPPLVL